MNTQNLWWTGKTNDLLDPALPDFFHDVQLGIGTRFIDDPTAASVKQAGVYQTNGHCVPGKITADFAKALCRAEMIENGRKVGAYSCNKDGRTMAEWVDNNIYKECEIDHLGNTLCLIYDRGTGQMYASNGLNGNPLDASKTGLAPFFLLLWGDFLNRVDGFEDIFQKYVAETDTTQKVKYACALAGTACDAMLEQDTDLKAKYPNNGNLKNVTQSLAKSRKFSPDLVWGTFQFMSDQKGSGTSKFKFKSVKDFVGYFADNNRILSDEEKSLIPQLDDGYILPEEVKTTCYLIANTRDTKRPMTNIMLRGDPSVGKTAGARAIAAGLGLPYTFITCNAGTEMYNLIGDMMPVNASDSDDSINEELFKDLPTATDISMDPVTAYEAITGVAKADATEAECMTELFRKQMKLCSEACGQGFRYVESPLVRAIRNGWVCELQEPSLITRPSVMPGLNGLLDETGCVVLPTGEMLHRHPDCIIISTLNVDLEGCRPLNQSFIDRHHLIVDMKCPDDKVIIVTAKTSEIDVVKGLDHGADDYLCKPFGIMEFISRVKAVLRRASTAPASTTTLRFGDITLDDVARTVTVDGEPVELTFKEYSLLHFFLEHPEEVLARERIMKAVWDTDDLLESRTIDMHVRTLRQKLGHAGDAICTVRKVGYKLSAKGTEAGEDA